MPRRRTAQVVLALVFAGVLLRWLPPPRAPDSLGRGDVWAALRLDRELAAARLPAERRVARARHGLCGVGQGRWNRWQALLRQITARTGPDARILLREMSRNEGWILRYDLYPRLGLPAGEDSAAATGAAAILEGGRPPSVEWLP